MQSSHNSTEGQGYEISKDQKGRFRVKTHGKDGADQFEVDAAGAARNLGEPLQRTLDTLVQRRKVRRPIQTGK